MNRYIVATLSGLALAGSAHGQTPISRHFEGIGFDGVELASSDRVIVQRGPGFSVTAQGEPAAVAALTVVVSGHMLRIGRRPGRYRDHGAIVRITMPVLKTANLSGSGDFDAGSIMSHTFDAHARGSGNLVIRSLRVDEAQILLEGSGDANIHGAILGSLGLDVRGSGSTHLDGTARSVNVRLDGSGDVDTRSLATADLAVILNGTGNIQSRADRTAQVTSAGSGDVIVTGHPRCVIHRSGSSEVICG